jgi:Arc/MetJ family transcription regulator
MAKTMVDIDPALLAAARTELGARTNKETVNRALAEIVAMAARRRLVAQLCSGDGLDLSDPDAGRSEAWRRGPGTWPTPASWLACPSRASRASSSR